MAKTYSEIIADRTFGVMVVPNPNAPHLKGWVTSRYNCKITTYKQARNFAQMIDANFGNPWYELVTYKHINEFVRTIQREKATRS